MKLSKFEYILNILISIIIGYLLIGGVLTLLLDCNIPNINLGTNNCSSSVGGFYASYMAVGLILSVTGIIFLIPILFIITKVVQFFKFTPEEKNANKTLNRKFYLVYKVILVLFVIYIIWNMTDNIRSNL